MIDLDLRHHDTLAVQQFNEIIREYAFKKQRVKKVFLLPAVVQALREETINNLERELAELKFGEYDRDPTYVRHVENFEEYIDCVKNSRPTGYSDYEEFVETRYGSPKIIAKERRDEE